jgi:hypothetical protein
MESKNNYRLVLTAPIKSDYIYNTDKIEKAGKKALSFLSKKYNINQTLITLQDLDSKQEYSFMANKKHKQNLNPGITLEGGFAGTPPNTDFLKKISEISKTIDESVDSLQTAVKNKEKKENENNIILIAKNGVDQLTSINSQLDLINKKIDIIGSNANKFLPGLSTKLDTLNETTEQIEHDQSAIKADKEQVKQDDEQIQDDHDNIPSDNLLEPSLGSQTPDENLCIIM